MKTKALNLLILLSLIIVSCNTNVDNKQNSEFEFSISGNIENGEGIVLSLCIPSQGLDNRILSTVTNGKYEFTGKAKFVESASIYFEENIIAESSSRSYVPLFIEPGNTRFNFGISGDSLQRRSENQVVLNGEVNKYYKAISPVIWKNLTGLYMFSDSTKNDSMHRFVYPEVKGKVLNTFDSLFAHIEYSAVYMRFLVSQLQDENRGLFQFNKLNEDEKEKLIGYFEKLDPSLSETPNYRKLRKTIEILRLGSLSRSFKDFELIDISGNMVKLSEVVKNNEYTVLDFWWRGCSPCRKLNKQTAKIYDSLKEKGIEIISISVDKSKKNWELSSEEDKISWINLYAGAVSDIELDYNVTYFPTKIIFDKNLKRVDFKFLEPSELLELVNE